MATETLLPDGTVVTSTNLTGAVADIDEGVDNFDGTYVTATGSNGNTELVLTLPTPTASLTSGAGLQTFRARVRKSASGGNTVTFRFEVWENGTSTGTVSSNITLSSTTGATESFSWNAGVLANIDGSGVEIALSQQNGGQGGNPGNRRWMEVDALDWVADYTPVVATTGYSFSTIF